MTNSKVSIVIPIYNGENYIDKFIAQLLNQSYKNIELVIINDGSIDGTEEKLNKFQNIDNITIVSKENEGVSVARNVGIDNSSGDYISFVDCDDAISSQYCETMVEGMHQENLVVCGYNIKKSCGNKFYVPKRQETVSCQSILKSAFDYQKINTALWNKMFNLHIIKKENIRFTPEIAIGEDMLFLNDYLKKVDNAYLINKVLYDYFERETSVMMGQLHTDTFKNSWYSEWVAIDLIEQSNQDEELRIPIIKKKLRVADKLLSRMYEFDEENENFKNLFLRYLRKNTRFSFFDNSMGSKKKVSILLNAVSPRICYKMKMFFRLKLNKIERNTL